MIDRHTFNFVVDIFAVVILVLAMLEKMGPAVLRTRIRKHRRNIRIIEIAFATTIIVFLAFYVFRS